MIPCVVGKQGRSAQRGQGLHPPGRRKKMQGREYLPPLILERSTRSFGMRLR